MKLILPVAGKGSRLYPLTHTVAKGLVPIAGKPVLQWVIDAVLETQGIDISEIIFITGVHGDQIEEWVKDNYDVPSRFIEQKIQNGSADAIRLAEPYVKDEDMLVIYPDALFDVDLEVMLEDTEADGVIWCAEVDDPKRFGIVNHDEEHWMTELEEKPDNPKSNFANIGLYYLKDSRAAFAMIDVLYEEEIKAKGEYNFPEALDLLAKNGKKLRVVAVEGWHDMGVPDTLLKTNKEYCAREGMTSTVHPSAITENCTFDNCIVMQGARIHDSTLKNSVIGPDTVVKNVTGTLFIGSHARVTSD